MYKEIEDIWEWESPCRFYWSFFLHITNPEFIIKMETEKKNTWEFVFGIEKLKMPSWISNVISFSWRDVLRTFEIESNWRKYNVTDFTILKLVSLWCRLVILLLLCCYVIVSNQYLFGSNSVFRNAYYILWQIL